MNGYRVGVSLLVLGLALGCGDRDGEAELEAATEALSDAKAKVAEARARVDEQRAEVAAAEGRLEEARTTLRQAEALLSEHQSEVDASATDAVLFRLVQKRLLTDEALEDVAISASVENGVVVLSGEVPDAKLRERAVELARETSGVVSVKSRILVPVAAGAKPPNAP